MLGFVFSFNARLGRLHFFLGTIVLAVVMTAIVFAIFATMLPHPPGGVSPSEADLMIWPVIATALLFGLASFTLQAMRIRDIGWDPVCVIPAWIALALVDSLIATRIPSWSLGHGHHGTIVGSMVNLALFGALLFWPSGDFDDSMPSFSPPPRQPDAPPPRASAASAPAARIAQATRAEFGRRA